MVMPGELQVNSYLFSPRDLVVSVPRTAETSRTSQQDTKVVNRRGGQVPALNRGNTALSRLYPAPKCGKSFLIPPFRKSGENGMQSLTETRHLFKLNSNVSA